MLYATSSYGGFLRPEDTILEPVFITGGCRKDEDFSHQTRRFSREAPQNGAFSAKPADDGHTDRAVAESHMAGMRPPRRRAAVVNTGSKSPSAVAPAVFYLKLLLDLHILRQGIRQTAFPRTVSIYHIFRQMERNFLIRYLTAAGPKLHLLSFWRFYKNLEQQLSAYCIYFLDQLCNTSIIVADF